MRSFPLLVVLVSVFGCSARVDDTAPELTPTRELRELRAVCTRGSYAPPANEVSLSVTCDGVPVVTGLACGASAELPADVACSLQPMRGEAAWFEAYEIPAGAEDVALRVVL